MEYIKTYENWSDPKKVEFLLETHFPDGIDLLGRHLSKEYIKMIFFNYYNYLGDKVVGILKKYIKQVNELYNNGGFLYRILLLNDESEIDFNQLGDYWTIFNDPKHLNNLLTTLQIDWEDINGDMDIKQKAFLITLKTESGNIHMGNTIDLKDYLTEAEITINDKEHTKVVSVKDMGYIN